MQRNRNATEQPLSQELLKADFFVRRRPELPCKSSKRTDLLFSLRRNVFGLQGSHWNHRQRALGRKPAKAATSKAAAQALPPSADSRDRH